jgi:glutathione S-transferase
MDKRQLPAAPRHSVCCTSGARSGRIGEIGKDRRVVVLTVHHLGISQSDRIVWLCEELELPYELTRYERDPVTRLAPAAYKALHPAGTAPVIDDGDVRLAESAAIVEYILERHGNGRLRVAPDQANYPDYLYWFHAGPGSFMPAMMVDLVLSIAGVEGNVAAALKARGDNAFGMIEQRLGEASYLAGDAFTAADIMNLFPLTTGRMFVPRDLSPFPNIRTYLARIGARPAFKAAMAKADPDLPLMLS